MTGRPLDQARRAGPAVLFVLAVALYAPSAGNGFIYDDQKLIVAQPVARTTAGLFKVFTEKHWKYVPYYRPLPWLTLSVQKMLSGNRPWPFHLFNVLLAGWLAVMVHALLRLPAAGLGPRAALWAAALVAFHPLTSSCVDPISGREALMAAILALAAVYGDLAGGRRGRLLSLVCFAAALLCREQALAVAGLFLLADGLGLSADPSGRDAKKWVRRHAPWAALVLAYLLARWSLLGAGGTPRLAVIRDPLGPVLSLFYALQTISAPSAGLVYEPRVAVWFSVWRQGLWLAAALVLLLAVRRGAGEPRRFLLFWGGWFVLALLPTANLFDQEARFAERHLLLALVAVAAVAGRIGSSLRGRWLPRHLPVVAGLLVLAAAGTISFQRAATFRDDPAFLGQWLRTDPRSAKAHESLGSSFLRQGNLEEAISHLRQALALQDDLPMAHNNLGYALRTMGRMDESAEQFRAALRIEPGMAEAHYNLGIVLAARGRVREAMSHYRRVLEIRPAYEWAATHLNLALLLAAEGQTDAARRHYQEALDEAVAAGDREVEEAARRGLTPGSGPPAS
ncbi:MAG: tetratricopeptide repeat protein [Acidobacteriota bacterium]